MGNSSGKGGAKAGDGSGGDKGQGPGAGSGKAPGNRGAGSKAESKQGGGDGGGGSGKKGAGGTKRACLEDFLLMKTVGKGSFGKVVQVRKKDDGKIYAMKVLKKEMILRRKQYEHTVAERRILENIDHPFIVSLRFAFQTKHKLYMVFDYFNGGELYHYLAEGGRFDEDRARFHAAEIICGLDYLHRRGIVYRDLKPENLILDSSGHIKIADFGLSKEGVHGDSITSICGTPEYLAPEILRKRPYGVAVDWWSMGTLLYEMLAGLPPFYDTNRAEMYKKILDAPLNPPPFMSPDAVDLCAKMLVRDPRRRLGYNGGDEIKRHRFFSGFDWDVVERGQATPPFIPKVVGPEDTANVAAEFTTMPAAVSPSPATSTALRDAAGGNTPPSFGGFTFTHESVIDGEVYRVSFSEDEFTDRDLAFSSDLEEEDDADVAVARAGKPGTSSGSGRHGSAPRHGHGAGTAHSHGSAGAHSSSYGRSAGSGTPGGR